MLELLTSVYVSILPITIAATLSTVAVKLGAFKRLRRPIDGGKSAWDGKRIFGDNKTWLGVIWLVVLGAATMALWGAICSSEPTIDARNWFYRSHDNTFEFNLLVGSIMGLAYAVAELPNSFMKRRQGIGPGKTVSGIKGVPNIILDHTDSIIGCALVMLIICPLNVGEFIGLIIIGAITHILVNVLLVIVKVKKNI